MIRLKRSLSHIFLGHCMSHTYSVLCYIDLQCLVLKHMSHIVSCVTVCVTYSVLCYTIYNLPILKLQLRDHELRGELYSELTVTDAYSYGVYSNTLKYSQELMHTVIMSACILRDF